MHIGISIQRDYITAGGIISNDTNPIGSVTQLRNQHICRIHNMLHAGLVTFHTCHGIGSINNQHNIPRCACGHRGCSADSGGGAQCRIGHDKLLGLVATVVGNREIIQHNRV